MSLKTREQTYRTKRVEGLALLKLPPEISDSSVFDGKHSVSSRNNFKISVNAVNRSMELYRNPSSRNAAFINQTITQDPVLLPETSRKFKNLSMRTQVRDRDPNDGIKT